EDLGKTGQAVELADRTDGDPRQIQRQQYESQTVMTRRLRIAAKHAEQPVGKHRARRPGLLAIDDVEVTVADGLAADGRHVRSGTRLRPALSPDVFARSHARQETLLLLLGAVLENGRREQEHTVLVHAQRRARAPVFLLEDQPLDQIAATA